MTSKRWARVPGRGGPRPGRADPDRGEPSRHGIRLGPARSGFGAAWPGRSGGNIESPLPVIFRIPLRGGRVKRKPPCLRTKGNKARAVHEGMRRPGWGGTGGSAVRLPPGAAGLRRRSVCVRTAIRAMVRPGSRRRLAGLPFPVAPHCLLRHTSLVRAVQPSAPSSRRLFPHIARLRWLNGNRAAERLPPGEASPGLSL